MSRAWRTGGLRQSVPEGEKDGGREGRMQGGIEGGREELEMYLKK